MQALIDHERQQAVAELIHPAGDAAKRLDLEGPEMNAAMFNDVGTRLLEHGPQLLRPQKVLVPVVRT